MVEKDPTPVLSTVSQTAQAVQPQAADSTALALQLIQVVGALALIIGLIFALAWLARKKQGFMNRGMMTVVERMPIGQKENLVLVRVNGQMLLLGVTAGSVNLLKSLDVDVPDDASADPGFALQLARVLGN